MVRLVTGGTGFIGRHLLRQLARRDGITFVLVRSGSRERLEALIESAGARDRLVPVPGDITQPSLGPSSSAIARAEAAAIYHLARVYAFEASEPANRGGNVGG